MKKKLLIGVFVLMLAICSATTIYDVQYTTVAGTSGTYPSTFDGQEVTVTGIVSAINFGDFEDNFFITMPEGGAWKGLYVYAANNINTTNPIVALGDEIEVTGYIYEYYGYTELSGNSDPVTVTVLSSGNAVPDADVVQTADLVSAGTAEQYESCLVEVHDVVVTEEQINYGQWYITDTSATPCQVDDGFFYLDAVVPPIVITLGMEWAVVRGCLDYSYDEFGINPRTPDDLIEEIIPVEADFSADPLTGTVPLEVQFTDASIGNITGWEWDFENDGTIDSNEQNPQFTYSEIGIYTVSLTVTDGIINDTEIKVDYIEVEEVLDADFTADPVSGIAPLEVMFTSISTGNVTSWEWDFDNDGTIDSIDEPPPYTYTEAGDYSVSLTVGDGVTTDIETKIDYISVGDQIIADFTADPVSGMAPLTVNFTNTSSGAITSWEWDFDNDGTIDSTDESPTFIYTAIGVYTVLLTVSDGTNFDIEVKPDYIEATGTGVGDDFSFNSSKLLANYPNPFNPSTIISFSVKSGDQAKIVIYNCKGQLIESQEFGAGNHKWEWNADSFPSGIYFYKLISSDYSQTRKMLLLK